jgi:predicted ATPase
MDPIVPVGSHACGCPTPDRPPRLVAVTGGPGAGKTAVLEMARRVFCRHVALLPEAAGIVFGGGFPRHPSPAGKKAAQRAIFHVQRAIEDAVIEVDGFEVALCDRGTLDGLAYWPGPPASFFAAMGTTVEAELARYHAVVHLETPPPNGGYRQDNTRLRVESADEADLIDDRIAAVWAAHPRRHIVKAQPDFLEKAVEALRRLRDEMPECCQGHPTP